MSNKYLEKIAGIPDLFPKRIGKGIESFMEGPANRAADHVIKNKLGYAAGAAGVAGGALLHKALSKKKEEK